MRNLRKFVVLAVTGGVLLQLACFAPLLYSLAEGFAISLLTSLILGEMPPAN
jgi:hypothetical protein